MPRFVLALLLGLACVSVQAPHVATASTGPVRHATPGIGAPSPAGETTLRLDGPATSSCGMGVQFTATVTPVGSVGEVEFFDGKKSLKTSSLDASGHARFSTEEGLGGGVHSLTAVYRETPGGPAVESNVLTHEVARVPASLALYASPEAAELGDLVRLIVYVGADLQGSIEFFDGERSLGFDEIEKDVATLDFYPEAGMHSIRAVYGGDKCRARTWSAPRALEVGPPSISLARTSVDEGDSGAVRLVFAATLSRHSRNTVTIDIATEDGTATVADHDYEPAHGTLVFPPGARVREFAITVLGDRSIEPDETVIARLSNPVHATLLGAVAEGTVLDDDTPTLSIVGGEVIEGNVGTTPLLFTLRLSKAVETPVSVDYHTVDAQATVIEGDYLPAAGTLTFAPGDSVKTIEVTVLGDLAFENYSAMNLLLSNPHNTKLAYPGARGVIDNDDPVPAFMISDASVVEGNGGAQDMIFHVRLSNPTRAGVASVSLATEPGSATEWADYDRTRGVLSISIGATEGTFTVAVRGDDTCESPDETFRVRLSGPVYAGIGYAVATGTIHDDDCDLTPTLLSLLTAEDGPEGIALRWRFDDRDAPREVTLERATRAEGPWFAVAGALRDEHGVATTIDTEVVPGTSYWYRLKTIAATGELATFGPVRATAAARVTTFGLEKVTPNPTPSAAVVEFTVAHACDVSVRVLDVQGRQVASLAQGSYSAGRHRVPWDARGAHAPAGLYFVEMRALGQRWTRMLVLAR